MSLLRIAAIDFLNPAPLMWNFEHSPERERLAQRYAIERMTPARCAQQLSTGEPELGLIPIAAYAELQGLSIVPGCAIASLGSIRSILLVLRAAGPAGLAGGTRPDPTADPELTADPDLLTPEIRHALQRIRSVALDTASRTSALYTRMLFRKYWGQEPAFVQHPARLDEMLASADAALLIGDPALFALRDRAARQARTGERLHYLDLGDAWSKQTGVPWVSAFWAARVAGPGAVTDHQAGELVADLVASRDAGLAHLPSLVDEWSARLALPRATVATYLGHNIHYRLDQDCLRGIRRFYADAAECGLIDREPALDFLPGASR